MHLRSRWNPAEALSDVAALNAATRARVESDHLLIALPEEEEEEEGDLFRYLKKLRYFLSLDGSSLDAASVICSNGLFYSLCTNFEKFLHHSKVVEEMFKLLVPLLHLPHVQLLILRDLCSSDNNNDRNGISMCLVALKRYITSSNLRILILECIVIVVENVSKLDAIASAITRDKDRYNRISTQSRVVSQMLLQGCVYPISKLFLVLSEGGHCIGLDYCLRIYTFICTNTPAPIAVSIASVDNWSILSRIVDIVINHSHHSNSSNSNSNSDSSNNNSDNCNSSDKNSNSRSSSLPFSSDKIPIIYKTKTMKFLILMISISEEIGIKLFEFKSQSCCDGIASFVRINHDKLELSMDIVDNCISNLRHSIQGDLQEIMYNILQQKAAERMYGSESDKIHAETINNKNNDKNSNSNINSTGNKHDETLLFDHFESIANDQVSANNKPAYALSTLISEVERKYGAEENERELQNTSHTTSKVGCKKSIGKSMSRKERLTTMATKMTDVNTLQRFTSLEALHSKTYKMKESRMAGAVHDYFRFLRFQKTVSAVSNVYSQPPIYSKPAVYVDGVRVDAISSPVDKLQQEAKKKGASSANSKSNSNSNSDSINNPALLLNDEINNDNNNYNSNNNNIHINHSNHSYDYNDNYNKDKSNICQTAGLTSTAESIKRPPRSTSKSIHVEVSRTPNASHPYVNSPSKKNIGLMKEHPSPLKAPHNVPQNVPQNLRRPKSASGVAVSKSSEDRHPRMIREDLEYVESATKMTSSNDLSAKRSKTPTSTSLMYSRGLDTSNNINSSNSSSNNINIYSNINDNRDRSRGIDPLSHSSNLHSNNILALDRHAADNAYVAARRRPTSAGQLSAVGALERIYSAKQSIANSDTPNPISRSNTDMAHFNNRNINHHHNTALTTSATVYEEGRQISSSKSQILNPEVDLTSQLDEMLGLKKGTASDLLSEKPVFIDASARSMVGPAFDQLNFAEKLQVMVTLAKMQKASEE